MWIHIQQLQLQADPQVQAGIQQEMRRFLPPAVATCTVVNPQLWVYLSNTVHEEDQRVLRYPQQSDGGEGGGFRL